MRGFSVVLVLWLAVAHTAACSVEARPELGSATTDPGQEVQQIIRTTASPFCPGKTLDSCPSPKAGEWRRDIHEWADAGVPADEIRVRLQNRVPHMDLSIRPARWSGVIPLIALLLSTLLMWLVARRILRRGAATVQREHSERQDLIDQQLDEELARWADGS